MKSTAEGSDRGGRSTDEVMEANRVEFRLGLSSAECDKLTADVKQADLLLNGPPADDPSSVWMRKSG